MHFQVQEQYGRFVQENTTKLAYPKQWVVIWKNKGVITFSPNEL